MTAPTRIEPGVEIGPYHVEAAIGVGGAGEVFRARDTKLGRLVAIKVLSQTLGDSGARQRFQREAQTASSLNHPHILTVHDIGEFNGQQFLVTEFVDGGTLAGWAERTRPQCKQIVELLIGVADALETAHRAGILHRDIKPDNILVSTAGYAKLGDFGLAKLSDAAEQAMGAAPVTRTRTGLIMGTVAYMSPEQATGETLDARSDIFSFGVVLYELLAGRRPFTGTSDFAVLQAIVGAAPEALPESVPAQVRMIVEKALEKDRADRYQSMRELTVDLRRSLQSVSPRGGATTRRRVRRVSPVARRSLIGAIVVAVVGVGGWVAIVRPRPRSANPLVDATFTRVTDFPGDELDADISRDGRFVAFLSDKDGPFDIFITQIGTGQFTNLTQAKYGQLVEISRSIGFTADGSEIWFHGRISPIPGGLASRILPIMGGTPRQGVQSVMMNWSPDGTRMVFHRGSPRGDPVFVADRDGANERQIFTDSTPGTHNHFVVWSPDGWIYFVRGRLNLQDMDVWRIRPSGGAPERMTNRRTDIRYLAPLDERAILFTAPAEDGSGPWLYALDTRTRTSTRISLGLEQYRSIASSADGHRLVATVANPTASLWSVPVLDRVAGERDVKPVALPNVRAFAPRIRGATLFYLSSPSGGDGLWRFRDNQAVEIWRGAQSPLREPAAISADGKRVAVLVRSKGRIHVETMDDDGADRRTLGDSIDVRGSAAWSPDGRWLAVGGEDAKGPGLFKIPSDGGAPVRLASEPAFNPVWSADGERIIYAGPTLGAFQTLRAVTPDGKPLSIPSTPVQTGGERYRFMPDGKGLVYQMGSADRLDFYLLDLSTGTSRRLTQFDSRATIRTFDITPDGRQIVFDRQRENSDIVLIERTR